MAHAACNWSIAEVNCTLQTCCLDQGTVDYLPSLGGNITYGVIFILILLAHLGLGLHYRTFTFLIGMTLGLVCEVIGYSGRIWMHYSIFNMNPFLIYLICLTLGPAFLSASIYLCLSRIVNIYGAHISRIQPKFYTIIFITSDLLALTLQAVGGAIASTADPTDASQLNLGTDIMIAGLSFQVVSLVLFIVLCAEFALRVRKTSETERNETYHVMRNSRPFKGFLFALGTATLFIFIRCCYRVAELQGGFAGSLANDEVTYMILEGPMIIIATVALVAFHPGFCLDGNWATVGLRASGNKRQPATYEEHKLRSKGPTPESDSMMGEN